GLPDFLTASSDDTHPNSLPELSFTIDTARIRALTSNSSSTITIRSPNSNRTDTLRLVVKPNLENGFVTNADCAPSTIDLQGTSDCTLHLADGVSPGQVITWRLDRAACFTGEPDPSPGTDPATETLTPGFSSYYQGQAFQHFQFPNRAKDAVI